MDNFFLRLERLLLSVWTGGLVFTGYISVPILFKTLESRQVAGNVAGEIFHVLNIVGLSIGLLLLFFLFYRLGLACVRLWKAWVLVAMLCLTSINLFVLQPKMSDLKILMNNDINAALKDQFSVLHGLSSVAFLLLSVFAVVLVCSGFDRKHERY